MPDFMRENHSTAPAEKKTRAQVLREKVVIRLALDETGPLIAGILKENGIELPGADWNHVFPHWLIACDGDEVIGCLLVLPAKPVGFCEFLHVKPGAGFKMRAIAIRKLVAAGIATVYHGNASYVAAIVDGKNQKFYDVLTKIGGHAISAGAVVGKRLK